MASQNLPTISEKRHNTVVKANALIQKSRFSLSTQQQKIVLFLISQIEPQDEDFNLYEFKIADFCRVCGIDPQGDNYTALKNQIKAISDKSLWIELESGEETLLRWIERPYISKRNGTIKIKIDREMKPYLLQLKERFTEYELIYTLNFKSKYSIRLYEYLKSIHYRKLKPYERTMDIEKFQKLLDSNYTEFKDFHTRVLKPAQKEINTYSDIIFEYELIKEGRKAVAISFTIKTKDTIDRIKVSCQNDRLLDKNIGD